MGGEGGNTSPWTPQVGVIIPPPPLVNCVYSLLKHVFECIYVFNRGGGICFQWRKWVGGNTSPWTPQVERKRSGSQMPISRSLNLHQYFTWRHLGFALWIIIACWAYFMDFFSIPLWRKYSLRAWVYHYLWVTSIFGIFIIQFPSVNIVKLYKIHTYSMFRK